MDLLNKLFDFRSYNKILCLEYIYKHDEFEKYLDGIFGRDAYLVANGVHFRW